MVQIATVFTNFFQVALSVYFTAGLYVILIMAKSNLLW